MRAEKAVIGIEIKDKKTKESIIKYVVLETEGHIQDAGLKLLWYWNSEELANSLIDCGNLIWLGNEIGIKHSYSAHISRPSFFYEHSLFKIRDCKKTNQESCKEYLKDDKSFLVEVSKMKSVEWAYLFKDGCWTVAKISKNSIFRKYNEEDANKIDEDERKYIRFQYEDETEKKEETQSKKKENVVEKKSKIVKKSKKEINAIF